MNGRKVLVIVGVLFLIALLIYVFTVPLGTDIPLTGMIDGNEVIVSPRLPGRIV